MYDLPDFKVKYLDMKKKLYSQFFKYMTILFFTPLFLESSRAWIHLEASILIALVLGIIATAFLFRFIYRLNEGYQEIGMTIFCFLSCLFITAVNFADPKGYFLDPLNSFYFGYGICSFERLILSKIPNMLHRNIFRIAIGITYLFIITPNQIVLYVMHGVHCLSGIYFDYETERRDKNLFKSYFNYKSQLMKFKDLVVRDIPDSIAVVTQDLNDCLFLNDSFSKSFKINSVSDVWQKLKEFSLQGELQNDKTNGLLSKRNLKNNKDKVSLVTFLETACTKWRSNKSQEKFSCNVALYTTDTSFSDSESISREASIFEAGILPIIWDEKPAIAIILHDITEQQTILSLKVADAQKDALLATVSHELRTPLNGMLGMIQIMQKQIQDKELSHYLSICKHSGNLLLALVNSILDLNQIQANTIKLHPEKLYLQDILNDILQLFEIQCSKKNLSLQLEISPDLDKNIQTDKNRLSQILINLVGNALKFTHQGGIKIAAVNPKKPGYIEFRVIDTGIGIKEEDRFKLFKIFGRLEQANTRVNYEGVGLGLTISDTLARLLGPQAEPAGIQLQSVFGQGSTFSFLIKKNLLLKQSSSNTSFGELGNIEEKILTHSSPDVKNFRSLKNSQTPSQFNNLSIYPETPLSNKNIRRTESQGQGSCKNSPFSSSYILIIDDNPLNLIVAERFVELQGYRVKTALSGQAAIDQVLQNDHLNEPIHLILMDLQMPGMDGYQATRHLKRLMQEKKIPEIAIVALTANNSEADKEACIQAGMSTYLCKPLKEAELTAVIKKFIKQKKN